VADLGGNLPVALEGVLFNTEIVVGVHRVKDNNVVALSEEPLGEVAPDKAGPARHKDVHIGRKRRARKKPPVRSRGGRFCVRAVLLGDVRYVLEQAFRVVAVFYTADVDPPGVHVNFTDRPPGLDVEVDHARELVLFRSYGPARWHAWTIYSRLLLSTKSSLIRL